MNAHTPGPWRAGDDDGYIYDKGNVIVATVMNDDDARLIAAAPEMLGLLKLAQVRLFMLDGANAEYEVIDALLTSLGVTNRG